LLLLAAHSCVFKAKSRKKRAFIKYPYKLKGYLSYFFRKSS